MQASTTTDDPTLATTAEAQPTALPERGGILRTISNYIALMKPGILTLLIATMLAGAMVASDGSASITLLLWITLAGILSAGGANVLNCYIDRDIDALMGRTKHRATATGEISPRAALAFGIGLTVASFIIFWVAATTAAALLSLAGSVYYVLIYTKFLKRRTEQNIVIGGAAGAFPPMVGWAAVTGGLAVAPVLMFAIIYYWTPPHFWALALLKQGEYGRADVPMLPVVAGERETQRQILLYTVIMIAVSLLIVPFGLGEIYLVSAVILNAIFLAYAVLLLRRPSKKLARQTFFYSIWYLFLVFAAMVIDRMVLGG